MPAEASTGEGLSAADDRAPVIDGRYRVMTENRLPELDSPNAEAFEASDLRTPTNRVFALLCRRGAVARTETIDRMTRTDIEGVMMPRGFGVVAWRATGERRLVIILTRPGGARLVPSGRTAIDRVPPHELGRRFLRPLAGALIALAERNVTHRAIRLDNVFFADPQGETVVLGDWLSEPPGLSQPAVYEPLEQAMADPTGRSAGSAADDCYALGVLLAVLLAGETPHADLSAEESVAARLKFGSYSALLGQVSVPLGLTEPLRGLLSDDPGKRWDIEDLARWLGGQQLTLKPPGLPPRAARPLSFAGEDHWNVRSLAHAMANKWDEALGEVGQPRLADWLTRSLGDAERADQIANPQVIAGATVEDAVTEEDLHLAWILLVLDPRAPLRFRGFAVRTESLGRALGMNLGDARRVESLRALLRAGLPDLWFELQESNRPEYLPLRSQIGQATTALAERALGKGLENCLYRLAPDWPCVSPLLEREYVVTLGHVLPALERLAEQGQAARDLMDRHIAAFCLIRLQRTPERAGGNLESGVVRIRSLAMLQLLAAVQLATGPAALPGIGRWYAKQLAPSIESFHNRDYRKQAAEEAEGLAAAGDLAALAALFDNERLRQADQQGFEVARVDYRRIAEHIAWLEQGGIKGPANVARVSRQAASILSALLSGAMLIAMTLLYLV